MKRKYLQHGFTLIELLVAVGVMALMIAFASVVFTVSIDTFRASAATSEIMQKMRAVTDQLDSDFKGLRKDAPVLMWFEQRVNKDPNRYDQIMFFADGDFSSIQPYRDAANGEPDPNAPNIKIIRGNTARVFYGQANVNGVEPWDQRDNRLPHERRRILARRQHILTNEGNIFQWPSADLTDFSQLDHEQRFEHDLLSLAQWQAMDNLTIEKVIPVSFTVRPTIDNRSQQAITETIHKIFCEGVGRFSIQWAYWDTPAGGNPGFYWFPDDVYLNNLTIHRFGVVFRSGTISTTNWESIDNIGLTQYKNDFVNSFPRALKFTFTIYDSKGVIKNGMTFSHIVYLEQ